MYLEDVLKKTEIGKIPVEWEVNNFIDVINVNPKRNLKKGINAKCVSMSDLKEFDKNIQNYMVKEFKGGSKFQNHDTLMARITPCLENGKTAFVDILNEKEVGFGSTEFIVLSGKTDKTTNEFVYYLSRFPKIRDKAIKSMVGTSGRQRVQIDIFKRIKIALPPIPEQKAIVKIVSDLDHKIELNRQMNATLEAIGQAIFKHWFVDFEFPNEEGKPYKSSGGEMEETDLGEVPVGWKVGTLGEIVENFDSKRIPLSSREREMRKGIYPYYGATSIMDFVDDYIFDGTYILMGEDGSVIDKNEHPILQYVWGKFWVNNHAHVIQGRGSFTAEYILLLLKQMNIKHIITGAVQLKINQRNMNSLTVIIPTDDSLCSFSNFINPIFTMFREKSDEIILLSEIRDALLPKLMSGEIRVNHN